MRGLTALRPVIFMLHDVPDASWYAQWITSVTEKRRVLALPELLARLDRSDLPPEACAITFDDGYRSMVDVVQPAMSARGLPWTVYFNTEVVRVGRAPWFARLARLGAVPAVDVATCFRLPGWVVDWGTLRAVLKELPLSRVLAGLELAEERFSRVLSEPVYRFLTPEALGKLSTDPTLTVGAHTERHPILANLDAATQEREIRQSVEFLADVCGKAPAHFAYPNGQLRDFDGRTEAALARLGIRSAVTTRAGPVRRRDAPFRLARVAVEPGDGDVRVRLKAAGLWVSRAGMRGQAARLRFAGVRRAVDWRGADVD